jgi:hypothetical protein
MYPIRPYPEVFADRLPWYEEVRTNFMRFVDAIQLEHEYYVAFPQTFLLPTMVQTLEHNVRQARKYIKSVNDYIESVPYLQSLTLYDRRIDAIHFILEDINLHEKKIMKLYKYYDDMYKYTPPAIVLPFVKFPFVPEEGQEDFQIA